MPILPYNMSESSTPSVQTLAQPSTERALVELPTRPSARPASGGADSSIAPTRSIQLWKLSPEDFEEVVTLWSKYTTDDLVKSSPFYTKTTIMVDPRAKSQFPEKSEITQRVVHAIHPIPRKQLQDLGPACIHDLGAKLEEERWDVDRTPEFKARVQETLARVDDALELIFRVQLPGTRVFSGRQTSESVEW